MSKTEQPTARRLRRAFLEGDVPYSPMLVRAAALAGAAATLPAALRATRAIFLARLRRALEGTASVATGELSRDVLTLALPMLAVACAFALAAGLFQTRGVVTFGGRSRNSRAARGGGFVNGRLAARAGLGAIVVAAVGGATLLVLRAGASDVAHTLPSAHRALGLTGDLLERLGWCAAAVLGTAAVIDLAVEHVAWLSRLRMTRHEIEEERREQEGDPQIRRARRQAHEMLSRETAKGSRIE